MRGLFSSSILTLCIVPVSCLNYHIIPSSSLEGDMICVCTVITHRYGYMCTVTFVSIKCCEIYLLNKLLLIRYILCLVLAQGKIFWKIWVQSVQQWKNTLFNWNICIIKKQLKLQTLNLACFMILIEERKIIPVGRKSLLYS